MDQRWAVAAFVVALASFLAIGIAAAVNISSPPLRESRWIDRDLPRPELVRALTTEPAECLVTSGKPAADGQIAIGRAVFNSPLLLGGQAARAGVACASCHQAGRGNAHFVFPAVSGEPGTADTTSSLFSRKRGDGVFNPTVIPDLAVDRATIDRSPTKPDLRLFIRGQIVEEFDGLEPPAAILDGLTAYVAALGGQCGRDVARTAEREANAITAAVRAAQQQLSVRDQPAAHLLVASARSALGRLDERYADVKGIRPRLTARDGELRQVQALAVVDTGSATLALERWTRRFEKDADALIKLQGRSLYSPKMLEAKLSASPSRE